MRERISRGKRIDNGEWVYWDRYGRITDINGEPTKTEIDIPTFLPYPTYIADLPIINDETVGDYTGLTDKNGKKIFEGDIVRGKSWAGGRREGSVFYDNYDATYMIIPNTKSEYREVKYRTTLMPAETYLEIIGNIHDNPELLEVEE